MRKRPRRDIGGGRRFHLAGAAGVAHPVPRIAKEETDARRSPKGASVMKRRDFLAFGAAMLCTGTSVSRALAQAKYPDRPIKLVVPFVPGGVNDAVARLWADRVKAPLGTVFIENQGGAGGAVGGAAVARAQPDGYTILLGGAGSQVLNPIAMSRPLYDTIKDFEPIAILATTPFTIPRPPPPPFHTPNTPLP